MLGSSVDRPSSSGPASGRIHGIDAARGLAMLGMLITHYVWADADTGPAAVLARSMGGRAMPLFMLLGGMGVELVGRRRHGADRNLLVRAGILFVLGLLLDAFSERIAIVLQFYGLLFAVSPLLRRLPSRALLALSAVVTVIGASTYQVVGRPSTTTSLGRVVEGWPGVRSLLFDGYYPFFPVAAFFALGMVVGRLDLRSERVARALAAGGAAVGVGSILVAVGVAGALGLDPEGAADLARATGERSFDAVRLLDVSGHSEMPAWVISAAGTSVAVVGLCLLVAPRWSALVRPVAAVGTVALTFYVFQALTTLVIPSPTTTGLAEEWATVAALYLGFAVVALVWKRWFRSGPFEALLRIGAGPRRAEVRTGVSGEVIEEIRERPSYPPQPGRDWGADAAPDRDGRW